MAEASSKKKRASLPKVRTGCRTCKSRRVKCDEQRPSCIRCLRFGAKCGGYENTKVSKNSLDSYVMTPKDGSLSVIFHQPRSASDKSPVPPISSQQPYKRLFSGEEENRYFQRFCDKTIPLLSGCVDSELWNRIVLQSCEKEVSIRYAVVAIGALDMTYLSAARSQAHSSVQGEASSSDAHLEFALRQYNKAIHLMRQVVYEGPQNARTTLLSCLLTIVFETYHCNYYFAAAQVQNGLKLINDLRAQRDLTDTSRSLPSSPAPELIEDELCEAFERLEVTFETFITTPLPVDHISVLRRNTIFVENIPPTFGSTSEARTYLNIIMNQARHINKSMTPHVFRKAGTTHYATHWQFVDSLSQHLSQHPALNFLEYSHCDPLPSKPQHPLAHKSSMQTKFFTYMDRWQKAFEPLKAHASTPAGSADYISSIALQLHYLTFYLTLVHAAHINTALPSKFNALFSEIVQISKTQVLFEGTREEGRYSTESMNILPLFLVARRCPDVGLRREAIAVLLGTERRKWVWDSVLVGKVGEWLLELELEMGSPGSCGSGSSRGGGLQRVRDAECIYSLRERKARVVCLVGEERRVRETFIAW